MGVQLVWFKKDLRVRDHRPLAEAARRGPCVCLFVYEPEGLAAPEWDGSHWRFLNESLEELGAAIAQLGGVLLLRHGPMPDVLAALHQELGIDALWSHQETGSDWTYARDRRVGRWAREAGVPWHELRQGGVVRRLSSRDVWAAQWQAFMTREILAAPARLEAPAGLDAGRLWRPADLGFDLPAKPAAQPGGEAAAREALRSFLRERGEGYRSAMSSPLLAELACSRLSPHLAFGTLSGRTAYQAAGRRAGRAGEALAAGDPGARKWQQAMESFQSRLAWRCHFTQKLEDEPEIEFRNMCRSFACAPLLQLASGCVVGVHYPAPIVDEKAAAAAAKARVYAVRQDPATIAEAERVYLKHGSRKRHAE